ncbi:unnamed protein product [Echinostoma caproni]|uniref:Nucleoporin_N domain-containing protein n=1 Tax=Echinostoma caproni TaxID=27848 RepID=A0A183AEI9_9TREM|nr:unnamed protein product [Echinostoma caproni]
MPLTASQSRCSPLFDEHLSQRNECCQPKSRGSQYAIVTGDTTGMVKFFDTNFMLLYWYHNLNAGPIVSVTFASRGILDNTSLLLESTDYPQCATINAERFVVEDFVVTTAWAKMIKVTVDGDSIQVVIVRNLLQADVSRPHLVICSLTGLLKVYDYETRQLIAVRDFGSNDGIQTCKYGPLGKYLAVGFASGYVRIVDAITLEDVTEEPFTYGRGPITHVDFSPKGEFCAYADSAYTTTLLRSSNKDGEQPWLYVGRIRVHYRPITDMMFWISRGCKTCRLFTISEDRTLAEYDLYNASLHNLPLLSRFRIEQLATPRCFCRLPLYYKEDFLFVATSAPKLKLLNATSFMCRKVVMAHPEEIEYHK